MLCEIKTVKTDTQFVERGSININMQHINSINRQIKQAIDEHEVRNQEAVDKILDKTFK